LKKWRPALAETHKVLFLEVTPKERRLEKMFAQKMAQKFFGQIWGSSGKNSSHPPKFACSYTYSMSQEVGGYFKEKTSN